MVHVLSWEIEVLSLLLKVRVIIVTSSKVCSKTRILITDNILEQEALVIQEVCSWIRMMHLQ